MISAKRKKQQQQQQNYTTKKEEKKTVLVLPRNLFYFSLTIDSTFANLCY